MRTTAVDNPNCFAQQPLFCRKSTEIVPSKTAAVKTSKKLSLKTITTLPAYFECPEECHSKYMSPACLIIPHYDTLTDAAQRPPPADVQVSLQLCFPNLLASLTPSLPTQNQTPCFLCLCRTSLDALMTGWMCLRLTWTTVSRGWATVARKRLAIGANTWSTQSITTMEM